MDVTIINLPVTRSSVFDTIVENSTLSSSRRKDDLQFLDKLLHQMNLHEKGVPLQSQYQN
jgi:hypothetical protein